MTACLLHNEPTSYSSLARLRSFRIGAEAKASLNRAKKLVGVDAKLGDLPMVRLKLRNTEWRTEPVDVEKSLDELWVGVKGQSN